ncbi:hypothetical protein B0F90DRAFT_838014 [Multifurca ochricompacta]|uniref:Protein kinase domain-containing protein n=1 Tax=Multifurca ochricompacta TaxID=376703 RepID=A0AAD4QM53_9AGAM|nr:hypothetical protein B0F90DRAFT_838014 [Multifurca ochricompacta]
MNKLLSETLGKSFDRYFVSSGPEGAPVVTSSEAGQYIHILSSQEVLNKKNFKCNKVGHLGALFFHDLAGAFRRLVEAADSDMPSREALTGIGTALPLPLFAAPRSGLVPRLRYNATTDFRLGLDRFPHLIIQVTPTLRNKVQMHRHPDRIRTILQASSLARLGNALRQDTSRPVVIVAIFIDSSLYLHEYHVYQPDPLERKVVYHRKDGSLHRPELAFEFIFRLYNLLSRVLVDNALFHGSYGLSLEKLDHRTEHYPPISLGTISLQSDDDDYQSDPPEVLTTSEYNRAAARLETIEMPVIRKRKNVFEDPLMKKPLGTAGYKLSSRYDHWDIMKLKPKMHVVIAPDTSEVLLKLSDGHSNELLILRFLSTLKSSQNRAIEFLGVLDFPIGTVMVLPWKPPIKKPHMYPVSWQIQFLEGVAFLHEHKIAHLDLNPNNVVFDKKDDEEHAQLWIIDFGLSLFVEDDETTVEGYCGTRDWTAPEVGTSDERDTKFSAIMADRWSCGKMLDYLDNYHQTRRLEGSEDVMRLREELSRFDPRARPSVREVLDAYLVMEKRQVDEARKRSAEEKGTGDGSQKRARGSAGGDAMDTGP